MSETPYRTPDVDTEILDRLRATERSGRTSRVIALFPAVLLVAMSIGGAALRDDVAEVSTRMAALAECRVPDDAELEGRRRLTREQDVALCSRACASNVDTETNDLLFLVVVAHDCSWLGGGRRSCHCRCRLPRGPFDAGEGEIVVESR